MTTAKTQTLTSMRAEDLPEVARGAWMSLLASMVETDARDTDLLAHFLVYARAERVSDGEVWTTEGEHWHTDDVTPYQ